MPGARDKDLNPDTWIGLSFPLGRSNTGFFKQTKTTLDQAAYNLENLLLTMKGERVAQPEFGTDLYQIVFESINDDLLVNKIEEEIRGAVDIWMPYIDITNIQVSLDQRDQNIIVIQISFTVPIEPNIDNSIAIKFKG